ncbi:hypothetical protein L195_g038889 [Trifolium pratense]|uniref:Uncharacterized protein n=1 Tax=Trifolium pratense TaxID=57577 RepID=A0A2K3LWG0_TRIPR|nr:hypothetical protein L195_g038889 [Trifolium pratense]
MKKIGGFGFWVLENIGTEKEGVIVKRKTMVMVMVNVVVDDREDDDIFFDYVEGIREEREGFGFRKFAWRS